MSHLDQLAQFKINDTRPFNMPASDIADMLLLQAHALTLVLADAVAPDDVAEDHVNPAILRSAIKGIGSLIELGNFAANGVWSR